MSLASLVAALSTSVANILALPQQITTLALAKITEITAAYNARLASLTLTLYVDAVNGADTNPGTQALPLRTIKAAVALVPYGGSGTITVVGEHTLTEDVLIRSRTIRIQGDFIARPQLKFARGTREVVPGTITRSVAGFNLAGRAMLTIHGMTIVEPLLEAPFSSSPAGQYTAPFRSALVDDWGMQVVKFSYCDIFIPSANFGALLDMGGTPAALIITTCVATGQALLGKLFPEYTNTAGTSVAASPWLCSNLANV